MNKQTTAAHQQQLLGLRSTLLEQIAEQRAGVVSRADVAADHFGHPDDTGAQLASARELEFAMVERELVEMTAIDAALTRIDAGTYGECTDCGKNIAPARLQATPEAARCIQCQEKVEQLHPV